MLRLLGSKRGVGASVQVPAVLARWHLLDECLHCVLRHRRVPSLHAVCSFDRQRLLRIFLGGIVDHRTSVQHLFAVPRMIKGVVVKILQSSDGVNFL